MTYIDSFIFDCLSCKKTFFVLYNDLEYYNDLCPHCGCDNSEDIIKEYEWWINLKKEKIND